jgi:hypothetical protein
MSYLIFVKPYSRIFSDLPPLGLLVSDADGVEVSCNSLNRKIDGMFFEANYYVLNLSVVFEYYEAKETYSRI